MAQVRKVVDSDIEDGLAVIRDAIERHTGEGGAHTMARERKATKLDKAARSRAGRDSGDGARGAAPVSASMQAMRVRLRADEPKGAGRAGKKRENNRFSGILGGDVRLEEALARVSRAPANQPAASTADKAPAPRPVASKSPPPEPAIAPAPPPAQESVSASAYEPVVHPAPPAPPLPDNAANQPAPVEADMAPAAVVDAYDEGWPQQPPVYGEAAYYPPYPEHGYGAPVGEPGPYPALVSREAPYISQSSEAAAAAAFARLAETVVQRASAGEHSLEDNARDVLRPLLKEWLDQHLPDIVERIVREEIARIARSGETSGGN